MSDWAGAAIPFAVDAVKEFETYLKLAPSGPNAKQAQDNVTTLKPLVK